MDRSCLQKIKSEFEHSKYLESLTSWSRTLDLRSWGIKHYWIWTLEINSIQSVFKFFSWQKLRTFYPIQFVSKLCSWQKLKVIVFYNLTLCLLPCLAIFKWMCLLCDLFVKLKFCLVFFKLCVCWGSTTIWIIINKEIFCCHM